VEAAFSPCGNYVMMGDSENHIKVWNVETGAQVADLIGLFCCVSDLGCDR
jgi:hypothetical protein